MSHEQNQPPGAKGHPRSFAAPDPHIVFVVLRGEVYTGFQTIDMPDRANAKRYVASLRSKPVPSGMQLLVLKAVRATPSALVAFAAKSPVRAEAVRRWREDLPIVSFTLPPVTTRRERSAPWN